MTGLAVAVGFGAAWGAYEWTGSIANARSNMVGDKLAPVKQAQLDLIKIYLQALFAALFGGVLLTFLNVRRDEDQREIARDAAVRDIVEQVYSVHRKIKMVKRRLRSQMSPPPLEIGGTRSLPYSIPSEAFERAMDDLLAAQIEAEQLRDTIRSRDDLIDDAQIERIHALLNYAARYAHDVYQAFEDCTVRREAGGYSIDDRCAGMVDFLSRRAWDRTLPAEEAKAVSELYHILANEGAPIGDRHAAFRKIEKLRQHIAGKPRYRIIATECIALVAADLQRNVRRDRWRSRIMSNVAGGDRFQTKAARSGAARSHGNADRRGRISEPAATSPISG
ncbi:hypothetical protein [Allosphingosinicella deserti]|uniref:hypothetical protein n=1 Tax=Allosphingosinicella deserti TaxID=2116704 RepID=UPI0011B2984C|nr:hypothetical protein [Sphingomonas deserti]